VRKSVSPLPPRVIGYLRVSTGAQDLENQQLGILQFANGHKWNVEFVEETVSGRVSYKDRELGKIVKDLKKDDVLIVSELSRLGRSMLEIISLLCELSDKGVKVYAIKGNHKVDNSIQSKVMTMVLCMAAEIEKELISQRTKEALQRKKLEGVKLGRPKGIPGKSKLDGKEAELKKLLEKGVGIASLAKIYDCAWPTMNNFIKKKVVMQGIRA
jgi:DNA invertase Pin-like site-specific DNA recombinase